MRIYLLAFGKLKSPGFRLACDHFLKMTSGWVKIEEIEMKPIAVPEKNQALLKQIQKQENALLTSELSKHLGPRGAFYLLDERGKTFPTQEWAKLITTWEATSIPEIALCIGSSLGFSEELRKAARGLLAFGPQTLSHELARLVCLEQLYRAFSVCRGHPYHNPD